MPLLGRRRSHAGDKDLIDRTPQNLPVQVGGFRVVRENRRTSSAVKWWRANAPNMVAAVGMLGAIAGAYLATTRPAVPAYIRGSIFIAGSELKPSTVAPHLYVGDAAVVYFQQPDKSLVATASTYSAGRDVAGRCTLRQVSGAELREVCDFWIGAPTSGAPTLTSIDIYDLTAAAGTWQRHYSDGLDVEIVVPPSSGGVVPVPLPVGR